MNIGQELAEEDLRSANLVRHRIWGFLCVQFYALSASQKEANRDPVVTGKNVVAFNTGPGENDAGVLYSVVTIFTINQHRPACLLTTDPASEK